MDHNQFFFFFSLSAVQEIDYLFPSLSSDYFYLSPWLLALFKKRTKQKGKTSEKKKEKKWKQKVKRI
jgi:hypothetical protein